MSIITDAMELLSQLPQDKLSAFVMLGAFGLAAYAIYAVHNSRGEK